MVFPSLRDRLPDVRGSFTDNAPLAPATWFRVGGPAQTLFLPADEDDLEVDRPARGRRRGAEQQQLGEQHQRQVPHQRIRPQAFRPRPADLARSCTHGAVCSRGWPVPEPVADAFVCCPPGAALLPAPQLV